jgi:hypothetical protein
MSKILHFIFFILNQIFSPELSFLCGTDYQEGKSETT